jgi:hypothetical protein
MNDAEWSKLRDLWQQEKGQLPSDLQRYARKQARWLLVANILFWVLVAGECGFALRLLVHPRSGPARWDGWVILGTVGLLGAWFASMQRRLWPKPLEIPSEMLARFERHMSRNVEAAWIGAGGFLVLSLFVLIKKAILSGGVGILWGTSQTVFLQPLIGLLLLVFWPRWVTHRTQKRRNQFKAWREELGDPS